MRFLALFSIAFLGGCSVASPPTVSAGPDVSGLPEKPSSPECEPRIRAMVAKYLPAALRYPARSAHREAAIDLMDTEFLSLMIGRSDFERGLCRIVYKYAVQDTLLKIEERHGIR
jgi:hypothetical protein